MQPWTHENLLQNMQNTNYSSSTDPQIGTSTQNHDIGPKYGSFQHNDSDEDNEVNFMDNDDEGLYSHEDDDFDNSFDDSDLQNKDPGKVFTLIRRGHPKSTERVK